MGARSTIRAAELRLHRCTTRSLARLARRLLTIAPLQSSPGQHIGHRAAGGCSNWRRGVPRRETFMSESMSADVALIAATVMFAIIILLLVVIWSIKRHRDPKLQIECGHSIEQLMPSLAGLTLSTAVAGKRGRDLRERRLFRRAARGDRRRRAIGPFRNLSVERGRAWAARYRTRCASAPVPACRFACWSTPPAARKWARPPSSS